ncbi:MAG: DUF4231 domain-containing protein [Solirubrobacteraceae bacterium]
MTDQRAQEVEDPREAGPAWDRLEDQAKYYGRGSATNKRWYTRLKIVQLVCAAAVPVAASVHAPVWVTGGLGAVVVVVEGIQQLGQYQANWINYRSTAESLKHEKFLYLSGAGPYQGNDDDKRLLAERTEALISQENTTWTSGQQQATHQDRQQTAGRGQGAA